MERVKFEELVQKAFDELPDLFRDRIDNVQIVVEDFPSDDQLDRSRGATRTGLLGLYEGVPLEHRGTWYGMTPTVPDRITLFQKNIESECRTDGSVERKIREVLIHEIGHYFGMSEDEIRAAGY